MSPSTTYTAQQNSDLGEERELCVVAALAGGHYTRRFNAFLAASAQLKVAADRASTMARIPTSPNVYYPNYHIHQHQMAPGLMQQAALAYSPLPQFFSGGHVSLHHATVSPSSSASSISPHNNMWHSQQQVVLNTPLSAGLPAVLQQQLPVAEVSSPSLSTPAVLEMSDVSSIATAPSTNGSPEYHILASGTVGNGAAAIANAQEELTEVTTPRSEAGRTRPGSPPSTPSSTSSLVFTADDDAKILAAVQDDRFLCRKTSKIRWAQLGQALFGNASRKFQDKLRHRFNRTLRPQLVRSGGLQLPIFDDAASSDCCSSIQDDTASLAGDGSATERAHRRAHKRVREDFGEDDEASFNADEGYRQTDQYDDEFEEIIEDQDRAAQQPPMLTMVEGNRYSRRSQPEAKRQKRAEPSSDSQQHSRTSRAPQGNASINIDNLSINLKAQLVKLPALSKAKNVNTLGCNVKTFDALMDLLLQSFGLQGVSREQATLQVVDNDVVISVTEDNVWLSSICAAVASQKRKDAAAPVKLKVVLTV